MVTVRPTINLSNTMSAFSVGAIVEDRCGHRFGVLRVESDDMEMSRYTLISCVNGVFYRNMPHYTMKMIKPPSPESVQLAIDTLVAEDDG